jgi:hypothetical protein
VFEVAALALALIHELAEPYPLTETSRGDLLDRVYESLSGDEPDRRKRVEWALQAGGEVR